MNIFLLTLSLLWYLKTRIRWGVNLTPPPSKSHVWCPNMTNDTSLKSSCALLLESAKKFANLQKLNFFCKIQLYSKNVCKKKIVQIIINYTFLKSPWPCHLFDLVHVWNKLIRNTAGTGKYIDPAVERTHI